MFNFNLKSNCYHCSGSGRSYNTFNDEGNERRNSCCCHHCNGSGDITCSSCHRTGWVECFKCLGSGRVKWFRELTVNFHNECNDYIKQQCQAIPEKKIRKALSQNIFSEQNLRLAPFNHHPDNDINQASLTLLNGHSAKFSDSRILAQVNVVLFL